MTNERQNIPEVINNINESILFINVNKVAVWTTSRMQSPVRDIWEDNYNFGVCEMTSFPSKFGTSWKFNLVSLCDKLWGAVLEVEFIFQAAYATRG